MNRDKKNNNFIILAFCSLLDGFCVNVFAGAVGLLWMKRQEAEGGGGRYLWLVPPAVADSKCGFTLSGEAFCAVFQ